MARAKRNYNLTIEMENLLGEFKENLILFEKCDKTIESYLGNMKRFIADNNVKTVEDFTVKMNKIWWLKYVKDMKENGKISIATLNKNMRVYSSFYNFLRMNGYMEGDIPCRVSRIRNKSEYKGNGIMTEEDVRNMLKATDNEEFKVGNIIQQVRDKLIVYLFCNVALRIDEMSKIRLEDINLETRTLYVRGKGGKGVVTRKTNFNDKVKELIIKSISQKPNRTYLFENYKGEQLGTQSLRNIWYRCQEIAGVEKHKVHSIRHFTGTKLVEKGVPVEKVKEVLGHSNINTCQLFYIRPDEDMNDTLEILDIFE